MPAVQELCRLYGMAPQKLTREENCLLEAALFIRICEEIKEIHRNVNSIFFRSIRFTKEMENEMLEANLIRCIINDILSTEEYTLNGLAYYTGASEEVIHEIMIGRNISPSLGLARKIIELHGSLRPNLYWDILHKIMSEHLHLFDNGGAASP